MTGSTRIGVNRDRYANQIEPRPRMWVNGRANMPAYQDWCDRADAWSAPADDKENTDA